MRYPAPMNRFRSLVPPIAGTLMTIAFELSVAAGWFQSVPAYVVKLVWAVPLGLWAWWLLTHESVRAWLNRVLKKARFFGV